MGGGGAGQGVARKAEAERETGWAGEDRPGSHPATAIALLPIGHLPEVVCL